jgi:hypothetical protein
VPTELPLSYVLEGAMVRSRFDLSHSRFEGGQTKGAFLATQLTLPAPAASVKLRLNGVFNALRVSVPDGTPVRVHGTGFPFNAVKRRVVGTEGRPGYEIDVDGIFNAIDIDTRPAAADEAPVAPPPAEAPLPAEAPPTTPPPPPAPDRG